MGKIEPLTEEEINDLAGAIDKCLQMIAIADKELVGIIDPLMKAIEQFNKADAKIKIMKITNEYEDWKMEEAIKELCEAKIKKESLEKYESMLKAHKGNIKAILDNIK